MNDKELLEYAALAMGKGQHVGYEDHYGLVYAGVDECGDFIEYWNPLKWPAKRFEMIEKLQMGIDFKEKRVWTAVADECLPHVIIPDKYKDNEAIMASLYKTFGMLSTRLIQERWGEGQDEAHAVLRVAAEIGKRMI